jgi:hypothetical protein
MAKQAQAQQQQAHAQYWLHRAQMETNRFKVNAKGQVVDTYTGQVKQGAVGQAAPGAARAVPTWTERIQMNAAGIDPDNPPPATDPRWAKVQRLSVPPKPPDELAEELRAQRLADLQAKRAEAPGNAKTVQEQQVLDRRNREVAVLIKANGATSEDDLYADPKQRAALVSINRKYAPQLQNVQDQYARKTGSAGYTVNPDTLEHTPREAQAAPAPAQGGERTSVIRKSDGRKGTILKSDFNPNAYTMQ